MKYKGQVVKGKNQEIIPIPREGGDIIFIANAVKSWDEFENLVPEPEVPVLLKPGGKKVEDKNDPQYKKAVDKYNELRTHYIVLTSIKDTPDVEWETVDFGKPETWHNYRQELLDSDFSDIEIGRIMVGVMRANSLDENMIDEARSNFLHGQQGSDKPD
ncbi:MAG: hypothetical protein U9O94_02345 [Nanoarchaeota archaeon]|nr:hypothetical protein [Nanoarchaeota archaeon]